MVDTVTKTPITQLLGYLNDSGLSIAYSRLWNLAMQGVFPIERNGARLIAVGNPKDIAAKIRRHQANPIRQQRTTA